MFGKLNDSRPFWWLGKLGAPIVRNKIDRDDERAGRFEDSQHLSHCCHVSATGEMFEHGDASHNVESIVGEGERGKISLGISNLPSIHGFRLAVENLNQGVVAINSVCICS